MGRESIAANGPRLAKEKEFGGREEANESVRSKNELRTRLLPRNREREPKNSCGGKVLKTSATFGVRKFREELVSPPKGDG